MIRADQIPPEAVKAALKAWEEDDQSFRPNAATIAAALNAWPIAHYSDVEFADGRAFDTLVLPLPQEDRT